MHTVRPSARPLNHLPIDTVRKQWRREYFGYRSWVSDWKKSAYHDRIKGSALKGWHLEVVKGCPPSTVLGTCHVESRAVTKFNPFRSNQVAGGAGIQFGLIELFYLYKDSVSKANFSKRNAVNSTMSPKAQGSVSLRRWNQLNFDMYRWNGSGLIK